MNESMFHVEDNFFVGAKPDGSVRLLKFSHNALDYYEKVTIDGVYKSKSGYGGPDFIVQLDLTIPGNV
jgi:hypothetical protein